MGQERIFSVFGANFPPQSAALAAEGAPKRKILDSVKECKNNNVCCSQMGCWTAPLACNARAAPAVAQAPWTWLGV